MRCKSHVRNIIRSILQSFIFLKQEFHLKERNKKVENKTTGFNFNRQILKTNEYNIFHQYCYPLSKLNLYTISAKTWLIKVQKIFSSPIRKKEKNAYIEAECFIPIDSRIFNYHNSCSFRSGLKTISKQAASFLPY